MTDFFGIFFNCFWKKEYLNYIKQILLYNNIKVLLFYTETKIHWIY